MEILYGGPVGSVDVESLWRVYAEGLRGGLRGGFLRRVCGESVWRLWRGPVEGFLEGAYGGSQWRACGEGL